MNCRFRMAPVGEQVLTRIGAGRRETMVQQTTSPYTGRPIEEFYDYEIELHDADGDEI